MSEYKPSSAESTQGGGALSGTTAAPAQPAAKAATSVFTLAVADKAGALLPPDAAGIADPCRREACELVFDVQIERGSAPDTTDLALYRRLEKIGHALRELYLSGPVPNEERFRPHFVRLFYIAQLALEGDVSKETSVSPDGRTSTRKKVGGRLSAEAARAEITALEADLIEDAAPGLKNSRLIRLAGTAAQLALPFLVAYVLLMLLPLPTTTQPGVVGLLRQLGIEHDVAANFMLLWVGTFVGVCLSYAIRTHEFGIADLTCDNPDFLEPHVRLLLTGTFAAVLAMVAVVGLGDMEIGSIKLSHILIGPKKAFVIGAILGLSEQKLLGTVQAKLGGFFGSADTKKTT